MTMTEAKLRENEELVREYHDVLENRQLDRIREFYAEDFTFEKMQLDGSESEEGDVEDILEGARAHFEAFPDSTIDEKEMAAQGDWVLCRVEIEATHEGEFKGIEPTGEEVWMQRHESYRIDDGEIVEVHGTVSLTPLLAQLGVELPVDTEW